MVLLEADPFLNELHKMFERCKKSGSVWITMKRTSMKPRKSKKQPSADDFRCLIRASDGKKKISTSLSPSEHVKFQTSYSLLLRAQMDSLKKREKTKAAKKDGK